MMKCVCMLLSCVVFWLSHATPVLAWGDVAHAVIGQLAEDELRARNASLRVLLTHFRDPRQARRCTRHCSAWLCQALGRPCVPWQTGRIGTSGSLACYPLMSSAIMSICPSPPVITVPGTARMGYAPLKRSWPNARGWLIVALHCRNAW
jgi:hypothetical protein